MMQSWDFNVRRSIGENFRQQEAACYLAQMVPSQHFVVKLLQCGKIKSSQSSPVVVTQTVSQLF